MIYDKEKLLVSAEMLRLLWFLMLHLALIKEAITCPPDAMPIVFAAFLCTCGGMFWRRASFLSLN